MKTITSEMVDGVANYLQFWFNPKDGYESGNFVDDYFYYHEDYGTLIGYPASYSSDLEVNDHHFHYGYWIKAAAAVAMNDSEWANEWGGMVYEMISDIANTNRDGSSYNENSPGQNIRFFGILIYMRVTRGHPVWRIMNMTAKEI